MLEEKELIDICLKHGAFKAHMISVDNISFDERLRDYCEVNQCGYYGKNHACPPHVGGTKDVIEEAKSYNKALVYQTIGNLTDSFDYDGMKNSIKRHSEVSDKIDKKVTLYFEKHLDLRAGPCKICEECSVIDNDPCKYPDKKRASLEAYCINVSSLAKECNMDYIHGKNTVTYFGAFLLK
ncbi:DUF2284 domain-containing protein [Saccharicrinis sp. 156]|uniref:DUF2284 domain-containing protein n=1 Tax=Saccharicrinis sp. 156 TaxID=3417574 RepID=UPI003D32CA83